MSKNFQFSIFNFQKRGFTLIETMVAITIVTLSIAGPLYTASRAIVAAENARDQLIASYLAQEGIEYVRMMRDDEYLAAYQTGGAGVSNTAWNGPQGFLTEIAPCSATVPAACTLDPLQTLGVGTGYSLVPVSVGTAPLYNASPLYLLSNGVYTQQNSAGTKQPFIRTIQAVAVSPTDERIISTVKWNFYSIPYSVTITDHLMPWQ